jgi:hypothetical protein
MTDRECLEQLLNSLEMKKTKLIKGLWNFPNIKEFFIMRRNNIIKYYVGPGSGYSSLYIEFDFDKNGKCLSHSVYEK